MPNKDLRIFVGPVWFGKIAPTLAHAMREMGIKATSVVEGKVPARYPDADYSVVMDFQGLKPWQIVLKRLWYFWQFLHQHDAFIFIFGTSLLSHNLDLPVLKLFHKKTVMWFIGSDIRHYESVSAAAKKMGIKYRRSEARRISPERLEQKKRMIHRVEKYVDYIISYPAISHLLTREYHTVLIPLDVENIMYNNMPNPRPVVVHAPSHEGKKGTSYILKAVERLKKEGYDFDFCLFQKTPNKVVRESLSKADIAVDQLFATGGGMFALESMAAGCAVLGGNIPEFSGYSRELPIIHTDPDNIYQNLKMLLDNPKLRQELGGKGRKYVEKYHDARKIAGDILQILSGNTENLISYNPQDG